MKPMLLGIAIAIPVIFSPLPTKFKVFIGGSASAFAVVSYAYEKSAFKSVGVALERKEKELAKREGELARLKTETGRQGELVRKECDRKLLESEKKLQEELEAIASLQHELELEKEAFDQIKRLKEGVTKEEIEIRKREVEMVCDRELKAIEELKQSELQEIVNVRKKAAISIKNARKKWQEQKRILLSKSQVAINSSVAEISEELLKEYEEKRDELLVELKELRSQLEKQAEEKFKEWLIPHCQEIDGKLREIESLKATVVMLKEQIAEDRDIKLSGLRGTVHGDRADHILRFLKERGIYCDYDSAIVHPDGTFVFNFLPWEIGSKSEKKIKGLLLAMQVEFGCVAVPSLQPNGEARAWTLTFLPARNREVLQSFYQQIPHETLVSTTFKDIEPVIRDGVAQELNRQQEVQEMMNFVPPVPLPRPSSWQISELEMLCFQWFYSWRAIATQGDQPNITTQEGLLYYVYAVRKGRSSNSFDELLNESLGDRVNRILSILQMEETSEV